jgi:hypothetical protein
VIRDRWIDSVFERYYARFGATPKLVDWHGSLEEWARLMERALADDRALTADDLARAQGQEGGNGPPGAVY